MSPSSSNSRRAALALAVVAALAAPAAAQRAKKPRGDTRVEQRNIELRVGDQYPLPTEGVDQFSEGLKGVVDVKTVDDPTKAKHLVLLAVAPGETTLFVLMLDGSAIQYNITVSPRARADAVQARDNIRLDFYFVETSAGGSYRVGLAWPGSAPDTGALGATVDLQVRSNLKNNRVVSATATIAGQVMPRIDLAQADGWAKVLRHATLVMTNGESGTFGSGGEVNVRVANGLAVGLEQIAHGTRVTVTPRYDRETGRIEVRIGAEVATLAAAGVDGLPGRNVTNVDTTVNVELGQAVVLAGLLGESRQKDSSGIPFLSQIPVLGYLFGTHGASEERTENILIIVPTVAEAVSGESRALVDGALSAYRRYEGEGAVRLTEEVTHE